MLQTTVKSTQLYYDNRLHMLQERRGALIHSILAASTGSEAAALEMPFFKICVARERVLEDALLAVSALNCASCLRKWGLSSRPDNREWLAFSELKQVFSTEMWCNTS